MSGCEFCGTAAGTLESDELYRDETVLAVLHRKPAAPGHILLFSLEHFPIMEQVPDPVIAHAFVAANKLSIALFETLNAQGSNVIIENGIPAGQTIPHFALHIIPRAEQDGLRLEWQPKKYSDDEMDIALAQIREQAEGINPRSFETERKEVVLAGPEPAEEKPPQKKGRDYRLRQLRRIP